MTVDRSPTARFAFISDTHLASVDGACDTAALDAAIAHLDKRANGLDKEPPVDFVVFGGDHLMLADDTRAAEAFFESLDRLALPHYAIAGNHDLAEDNDGEPAEYNKIFAEPDGTPASCRAAMEAEAGG